MSWKLTEDGKEQPFCDVCGNLCYDVYMVRNALWKAVGLGPREHAHIDCLDCLDCLVKAHFRRDGLRLIDFPNVGANKVLKFAWQRTPDSGQKN